MEDVIGFYLDWRKEDRNKGLPCAMAFCVYVVVPCKPISNNSLTFEIIDALNLFLQSTMCF